MKRWKVPVYAGMILLMEGISFPLVKIELGYLDAMPLLALRGSAGALAVFFVLMVREQKRFLRLVRSRTAIGGGLLCGLVCGLGMVVQTVGLQYTTATKGAFISSLLGVLIPIVGLCFGRRPPLSACAGLVGATVGLAIFNGVVRFDGGISFVLDGALNFGDGLMLLSAICFAVQLNALDCFSGRCDPMAFSAWQAAGIALLPALLWLWEPGARAELWEPAAIGILLLLGPFASGLLLVAQVLVQREISPARAALIYAASPIPAALFAAVIPDRTGSVEQITPQMAVGGAIVVLSVAGAKWLETRRGGELTPRRRPS